MFIAEVATARNNLRAVQSKILRYSFKITAILAIIFLVVVSAVRSEEFDFQGLLSTIIKQDYFPPPHMLFAAMSTDFVHPELVIQTNLCNSLMFIKYPYLQTLIYSGVVGGEYATRSASHALYFFAEGYVALGWVGWLYNGIVPVVFLGFWRILASTNNKNYNVIITALLATQIVNAARGQSSYFIKDLYIYFLPAIFMLWLLTGLRPSFYIWYRSKNFKLTRSVRSI